ncbi:MAG TPA: mucoidy inhibitor MuiA family protein [Bradyrhizobium sp.]|uniref:mucoidy inhibitor MuiA family protein n=1 Tax=Bradyrhizobium sp. TaxID=376 RepID=UPI002C64E6B5|nr:mucoidy inhibitor MuiA family protein [Bradyrhizobium sp.]HLZ05973.1 mucoidy inhibitor MuiA family protein [Bradyrhizobium sp.]
MRLITNCLTTSGLVLVTAFAAAPVRAADLDATSTVDAVTVYPDGASVTRVITLDLPSGDNTLVAKDFPPLLDKSSLRVEGEAGAKLTIGAIDARPPKPVPPVEQAEIDKRIEALKDQRADLSGAIAAAVARKKFAERFAQDSPAGLGEKGEARPLAEWRAAFAAVAEEVANADTAVREAQRKQREIDRQIARLKSDRDVTPPEKLEVRIDLAAAAATKATLRVTYSIPNARWTPIYDVRLDTGSKDRKPSLELVRRAEIIQSTGEDWSNVVLGVSTVRTARGGDAPDLGTLVVQYPQAPRSAPAGGLADRRAPGAPREDALRALQYSPPPPPEPAGEKRAEEQEASAEVASFQAAFKIPGRVSVGASEGTKSLRIASMTVTPDLVIRSTPVLDPTAFLEASFVQGDTAPLLPGKVSIYRDGMFVGRGTIVAAGKDETVRLGFGADGKVKIERAVLRRNEGSAGLIVTSRTDQRAFKTTIRNGHDFAIKVAIEDQLPVSENEEIAVEMLPSTTPPTRTNVRDKRGVLEWAFEAKPAEVREINFAWRVRWPKDKGVVMVPAG